MTGSGVRIGVYVCHCGGNISDTVDVKRVVEEVGKEPGVVTAVDFPFMCSEAGQKLVEDDVRSGRVNAVVVAACSPRLHEATFRAAISRAGGNPYMYYHVDIREECSWAHEGDREGATEKAIRQVRMAVAYLRRAEPLSKIKAASERSVLVIGGGLAGLRAALDLAEAGIRVYLVERSPFLGGNAARLGALKVFPYGRSAIDIVRSLIGKLVGRREVTIFTNAEVEAVSGYIGNFDVRIKVWPRYFKGKCAGDLARVCPKRARDEFYFGVAERTAILLPPFEGAYPDIPAIDINLCDRCGLCAKACPSVDLSQEPQTVSVRVGAIIAATGFRPYAPRNGECGRGLPGVITLHELVGALNKFGGIRVDGRAPESAVFIYCVGSRQRRAGGEGANEYCSRYCCIAALDAALHLRELLPGVRIYHVARDIRSYGVNELLYEAAGRLGDVFVKYSEEAPPRVERQGDKLVVRVRDVLTESVELEIPADLVVLVTGMEPSDGTAAIAERLKLQRGPDGFLQEVHPKLKPVETALGGIFIAGTAQAPRGVAETLASASAAAARAASLVLRGYVELEPFVAYVDASKCNACEACISECPYGAIEIVRAGSREVASVNEALCKGCGACIPACPNSAIQLRGLTSAQIEDMIRSALGHGRGA
jgi:heterodisulfide reductase subunit A